MNLLSKLLFPVFATLPALASQTFSVTIVDRQDHGIEIEKHIQGNSFAVHHSATMLQDIVGHTLTLLLPDQRTVVVNCNSKYVPRGDYVNARSCRVPLVNQVDVEFKGAKAKLFWDASIDGSKRESETYNILGVK